MSGRYTSGNEQQDQGSIKLANARIGFIHEGIELSFWMKNIFDYKYADRATMAPSTSDGGRPSGVTYLRNYPGERRPFGIRPASPSRSHLRLFRTTRSPHLHPPP